MAKIECELNGDFGTILNNIERAIMSGSMSASKEDESNFDTLNCKCAVRVFERYSAMGGNRVSLNITLLQCDTRIFITAISSGGSQALLFKINTFGEAAFLDCITDVIRAYLL